MRSRPATTKAFVLVCCALVFCATVAAAHQSSIVYSRIVPAGRRIAYTFQISNADLYEAIGVDRDRPVEKAELTRGRGRLFDYLAAHVRVTSDGAPCPAHPGSLDTLDSADGFFAVATLDYECARSAAQALITYDLFFDLDPRHQGLAKFDATGDAREHVFTREHRTLVLDRVVTRWDHVRDYFHLGVEHIFTGYDHLCFLFGLLLVATRLREVITIVSAFTVAHSLTLIASALGWISLPSRLVEAAIAASIVYVAVENLLRKAPRRRWLLTFAFGLIHGLGFASVLRELGLPDQGLVLSLVSFNVGVEAGQLAVVAVALPLLVALRRRWDPRVLGSVVVAGLGLYWLIDRLR